MECTHDTDQIVSYRKLSRRNSMSIRCVRQHQYKAAESPHDCERETAKYINIFPSGRDLALQRSTSKAVR
jgi:hypothetical protein